MHDFSVLRNIYTDRMREYFGRDWLSDEFMKEKKKGNFPQKSVQYIYLHNICKF